MRSNRKSSFSYYRKRPPRKPPEKFYFFGSLHKRNPFPRSVCPLFWQDRWKKAFVLNFYLRSQRIPLDFYLQILKYFLRNFAIQIDFQTLSGFFQARSGWTNICASSGFLSSSVNFNAFFIGKSYDTDQILFRFFLGTPDTFAPTESSLTRIVDCINSDITNLVDGCTLTISPTTPKGTYVISVDPNQYKDPASFTLIVQ